MDRRRVHSACIPCSGVGDGVGAGTGGFGNGGVELGVPHTLGIEPVDVNDGKLAGSENTEAEGPGVLAAMVVATFCAGAKNGAETGAVAGLKSEDAGFSPKAGDNDTTGGVFERAGSASVGCASGGGEGVHWPKGVLGAAGCETTVGGGADLEIAGGFSTSSSRTMGVLASGELRAGRLFERGASAKGEVGGGETLSGGVGICIGTEAVSLTGEPGGVVLWSLTGDP